MSTPEAAPAAGVMRLRYSFIREVARAGSAAAARVSVLSTARCDITQAMSSRYAAGPGPSADSSPQDHDPPARRLAARHLSLGLVPLLAGGFLAGCGQENAYCVDDERRVIDNEQCDDDTRTGYYGGHFWAFTGGKRYGPGQTVDPGSQRIAAADRAALSQKSGFGKATSSAGGTGRSFGSSGFGSFGG